MPARKPKPTAQLMHSKAQLKSSVRKKSAKNSQPEKPKKIDILTVSITLLGAEPKVIRKVDVETRERLSQLHHITQAVMGWLSYHL